MKSLSYIELKRECARKGLGGAGTMAVLQKRYENYTNGKTDEKKFIAETDNSTLSPDKIPEAEPKKQIITESNSDIELNSVIHDVKWQALSAKLDDILKGRVTYYLDKKDNCINFSGGGYQSECVTYTAPESVILKIARKFVEPTIIVPNYKGYIGQSIEDDRKG